MVQRFVSEGAKVVIIDLDGQNVVEELGADNVALVKGDVSKREIWEKALETGIKQFGGLHILVVSSFFLLCFELLRNNLTSGMQNNAGVSESLLLFCS